MHKRSDEYCQNKLLIKKGPISLKHWTFVESMFSHNSQFRIQDIHTAVVLAAAGHSGDKSEEVSPGNGLQKGSGS